MLRRRGAVAWLASVLLLGACSLPSGVDGQLTDDWAALVEPGPFVPIVGVCHDGGYVRYADLASFAPVNCGDPHRTETVFVGAFTGDAADWPAPPELGSVEYRVAFTECDRRASDYVGDEWRHGRLWVGVVLPTERAWAVGSRWFRCDVSEVDSIQEHRNLASRTGSVKDALVGTSPLRLGCYSIGLDRRQRVAGMSPVRCGAPHNTEFVGVFRAPEVSWPGEERHRDLFIAGCRQVIARFVGLPDDTRLPYRTGTVWFPAAEPDWRAGDRGVRCYAWLGEQELDQSLHGAGPAGLPAGGD